MPNKPGKNQYSVKFSPFGCLFFRESDINFRVVKAIIRQYKQFYAMPKELPDRLAVYHLVVLVVFFFSLGFMVSQVIIFLMGK